MNLCTAIVERIKRDSPPFYRPQLPQQDSDSVHPGIITLMKQCWAEEPSDRPSFDEIARILKSVNKGKSVLFIVKHFRKVKGKGSRFV